MLYIPVDVDIMQQYLKQAGRDNFSRKGLGEIIQFYEDTMGDEMVEFYPVDIDCTFIEYDLTESKQATIVLNDYGYLVDGEEFEDDDEKLDAIMERITEETAIVCADADCFIFDYNF